MKEYSTFIFDSFELDKDNGQIHLRYSLDDEVHFSETLTLPSASYLEESLESPALQNALFLLHLLGGVSYYKTCLPKQIEIRSGKLTGAQAAFFSTVYQKGLGEFYYRNNITDHTVEFPRSDIKPHSHPFDPPTNKILIPFGGGKDSIITTELLRNSGCDLTLFRMGGHPLIDKGVQVAGIPCLTMERQLDPELFEMNKQEYLNGHVPITAYLSAVTVVLGLLYGFKYLAWSNERGASEGNTRLGKLDVNHQWSKSLEFEEMLHTYIRENITPDLEYFSFLRPLSELQIVKRFTELVDYFEAFTSCNANWRIMREKPANRWIADPKTAFAYALFAAFFSKADLDVIFEGVNYFDDGSLATIYKELLGLEGFKPFECVGTAAETQAAFYLAYQRGELNDSKAMKVFVDEVLPTITDPEALVTAELTSSDKHGIPEAFVPYLPRS